MRSTPQNWLLISVDQWRGDWLHQGWLDLPYLRSLCSEGWDVRRCYTSSPQCIPARASWLTGLTPGQLGVTANAIYSVPPDAPSFVRQLRDQHGYCTALVGKTHWTPHEPGVDLRDNEPLMESLGFGRVREIAGPRALAVVDCELTDLWRSEGVLDAYRRDLDARYKQGIIHSVWPSVLPDHLYPDLWLTGIAIDELRRLPQGKPWLLWVSYPGPHEPFDVPSSWIGNHGTIPPPEDRPSDPKLLEKLAVPGSELARKLERWPDGIPEEALRALRSDYADHLHLLDSQIGELIKALSFRSDFSNTAITVCSDHGELLGDWGLLLKGCFLEGAIRSLFVHRPPDGRHRIRRWWQPSHRAYGLTPCLWGAAEAVARPDQGSFGARLRRQSQDVLVEFADERLHLR